MPLRTYSARCGFHRATIKAIAKQAGVADGTIYNSFESKTALLLALLDPLDERAVPLDPALGRGDPNTFVRAMLHRSWAHFSPRTLEVLRTVLSEALVDADFRLLYVERVIAPALTLPEPIFAELVSTGRLRSPNLALLTRSLVSAVLGYVMLRLLGDAEVTATWETVPDHLTDLLLNGMLERGQTS